MAYVYMKTDFTSSSTALPTQPSLELLAAGDGPCENPIASERGIEYRQNFI